MPPSGKLKAGQIADLRTWIEQGAPFPQYAKSSHSAKLWSLAPLKKPNLPRTRTPYKNPIDAFILAKLEQKGFQPAPLAGKRELLRRVYFDLIGLPPSPVEAKRFLADVSPKAYERLVDRLLASSHYGERWARYWLDLVRYADTNGYERDGAKPYAWKYRDYVIRALNSDKPFSQFLTEQLAGDEVAWRSEESVTATGFLRLGTWDDEPNDALEYKYERLDDLVHATGVTFLGLTVRCARCHDHKFDPIPQKDYYAFGSAFFGGYLDPGDGKLMGGPPPEKLGYPTLGFTEKAREAPALHLLTSGDPRRPKEPVSPAFLSLVSNFSKTVREPASSATTSQRRLQLAEWLLDPRHPLTARVFVNRIWQHHFGEGLVRTPNNFGTKGTPPTHPELLDWLAKDFMENGWRIKRLHRLILLSDAYRRSTMHPLQARYLQKDASNLTLWRFNRQRLDADALRDSILAISGNLNMKQGGEGFTPSVTREALEGLSRKGAEWNPSPPDEQRRRSIYMFLKRALIMPFMTAFDFGDTTAPLEQRDVTTVAPQALALLNNPFVEAQAEVLARRIEREGGKVPKQQVERLWRLAFGRSPNQKEERLALEYLQQKQASSVPVSIADTLPPAALRLHLQAGQGVEVDAQNRVIAWQGRGEKGVRATQQQSEHQPLLVLNAWRGNPALRFNGMGNFLQISEQVLTSQRFTLFAVASDQSRGGSHREIFSNWSRPSNIGSSLFLGTTGAGMVRLSDAFAPAGVLAKPETPFCLTAVSGDEGAAVFQNRTEIARIANPLPPRNLSPPYVIGQQGNIMGEYWKGDIFEILVYDRALSRQEIEQVWDVLNRRYGTTLRPTLVNRNLASLCLMLFNANEFVYRD
jgi:hypothetical protein